MRRTATLTGLISRDSGSQRMLFPAGPRGAQDTRRGAAGYFGQLDAAAMGLYSVGAANIARTPSRSAPREPIEPPDPGQHVASNLPAFAMSEEKRARQFREVALPHLDDAYNLARWLSRSAADADDIVQDAYMRAYQFFDGFRGTNPRAWILTIVRNSYYAWARKARSQAAVPLHGNPSGDPDDDSELRDIELWDPEQEDAESRLIRKTEAEALHGFIAALPVAFRETLVLREMHELPYQQIAEITGVPIGTVMSRLARARGLLQKAWAAYREKEQGA
jgi:RNA polymerase sigma-70 factor, ECF subfamily